MTMADQLTRLAAAGPEAHAIDHVVEPPLERIKHVVAGDALGAEGALKQVAELAFHEAVVAAGLLLFAQLETIANNFRLAILAVLAGSEVALFDGALFGVAALPF